MRSDGDVFPSRRGRWRGARGGRGARGVVSVRFSGGGAKHREEPMRDQTGRERQFNLMGLWLPTFCLCTNHSFTAVLYSNCPNCDTAVVFKW